MNLNTKTIIREEVRRQLYSPQSMVPAQGSQTVSDLEHLGAGHNILSALAQNLHELTDMESKLNFMVREVSSSLRSK